MIRIKETGGRIYLIYPMRKQDVKREMVYKWRNLYGIRYDWNRNGSGNYLHFDFRDDRIQEDSK